MSKDQEKPRHNTDNFKGNLFLSPLAFAIFYYYMPKASINDYLIFGSIFYFSARFFNPDLDLMDHRPGKAHFPIGKTAFETLCFVSRKLRKGGPLVVLHILLELIITLQKITTKAWYLLWQIPSYLVTHRGIYHWPVIGVLIRLGVVGLYLTILFEFLRSIGITGRFILTEQEIKSYYLTLIDPGSKDFYLYCLPIYLSDIFHSAVDMVDSKRNGSKFCPRGIPRGLIAKVLKL